ncbi:MAG TPA: aromatase/cyclase [Jatrophihabitans sp.]|nr:aromatase/cyclase [Jatrophihabitans sp.]
MSKNAIASTDSDSISNPADSGETEPGRRVEHEIIVAAPAAEIYRLIVDVRNWPRLFPPTIHVEHLGQSADTERIRICATANGAVKTWTSRRRLDPAAHRIDFWQEISAPPVAWMGGSWLVEELEPHRSRVRLLHDYRAIGNEPGALAWIDEAVDRNSRSELAALKSNVELAGETELFLSFEDSLHIDGAARDVYDFLNEAQLWTERLPHVARVRLSEDTSGVQLLEMDTLTKDGSRHTTSSVRICSPHERIVYKQIVVPALMTLHTGYWQLTEDGTGTTATSQHSVVINRANIAAVLGDRAGIAEAREFIRNALGNNSRATLRHAKSYAESRS